MNAFIRCRTCFKQNGEVYSSINNVCYSSKSVKEVIIMLVPQMDKTLDNTDFICKNCLEILRNCMKFVEKCLEVETELKAKGQILNAYSNESKGAATIRRLDVTSQPLMNICANVRDNQIQKKGIEKENMQENCFPSLNVGVNGQQITYISQGNSTFERGVQNMGSLVFLLPLVPVNNIPVEKPKINCNVNLLPNLENAANETDFSTNEDNSPKNNYSTFHLDNGPIAIGHNYCTEVELLNIKNHNRVVTLEQPNGTVLPDFISYLLRTEIKVLQISKNPGPSISSTKKRILLLGNTDTLQCPKCLKYFESIAIYNKHIIKCQKGSPVEPKVRPPPTRLCRLCDKKIEVHQMKLHRRQHELEIRRERKQKLKLRCQTCSERFTSEKDYELHLEFHPPHICDQCGKGFVRKVSLQAHKNTHNAPNSFICEICGKGYKDMCSLRCHIKQHQNKSLKCDKCSKLFKTDYRLRCHIKSVHDKKHQVQCNQCGILLSNKGSLGLHIRLTHLKMKPFKCKICGTEFGRADYLRNHVKRHTGEIVTQKRRFRIEHNGKQVVDKPVACKFCGKYITSIHNLKKHLNIHIKTRRYPCQFCSLTFAEEQFRKRHELIHQNVDSTVRCNICYKRFKTKEEVDEHILTHKKPRYACDTCGQLFHRRYLLDHHNSQEHMTADDLKKREEMLLKTLLESVGAN